MKWKENYVFVVDTFTFLHNSPLGEVEGPGQILVLLFASTRREVSTKRETVGIPSPRQQPFNKNHLQKLKKLTFLPINKAQQARAHILADI